MKSKTGLGKVKTGLWPSWAIVGKSPLLINKMLSMVGCTLLQGRGTKIIEALLIFFQFRETRHCQWQRLWAVGFTSTEESHSVCFWWSISSKGYQTEDNFSSGTLSRWRFMFWDDTLTFKTYRLQFLQKGNEQLYKLSVCGIWKRMKIHQ